MNPITEDPLDRSRYPIDEWSLIEREFSQAEAGRTETVFAVGNGYLGLRGNHDEGRSSFADGTFINGFHETWPIRHAEEAFGFARVGQTIVNVPDAKILRLYVDDEPFVLTEADLAKYSRVLDMRDGVLRRELEWLTPSGKRVFVRSTRMTSFTDRHLAVVEYEVTVADANASILISSQILNRQDRTDEYKSRKKSDSADFDPRKAETLEDRVLQPMLRRETDGRYLLGYHTTNSGMTVVVGAGHAIETENEWEESVSLSDDLAKHVYRVKARAGVPVRLVKTIAYHSSNGVPTHELADRCDRTLDRANEQGTEVIFAEQRAWLDEYWKRSDVVIEGKPELQQAIRWNIFQLAQSTARTDGGGIAAKGVTGSGYGGHYFWDAEVYVLPFLSYTSPLVARNALRFRHNMLDAARDRASELNQYGALFPWRTINGLESSAYYAAGTAQYHIDADISYALMQYVEATGDTAFLARGAIDVLVETARMWADLGFWRSNGHDTFHIHGVTGPDEYTTVVNDNLYTNVMARANLRSAVSSCEQMRAERPEDFDRMVARLNLTEEELVEWSAAAEAMHVPFDSILGIHPQDAQFLEKELWDLESTPADKRPLLLHYHPLVIYRFQVLKQADVVLALLLQGNEFSHEEKRRNFEYYDALTTGDSTLSAVVQSIIAAEVGYSELALKYFTSALFVDLADLHRNASDGVHVASTGGVWSALVMGFGGMRDHGGKFTFDPRLPDDWSGLEFRITVHGTRVRVELRQDTMIFTIEEGDSFDFEVRGQAFHLEPELSVIVDLTHQGKHIVGTPSISDIEGTRRSDGSLITSTIPTIPIDRPDGDVVTPSW
ncbi:glycoside hydrolase family 65 protein [Humidisolicoccus flavus]|uniref:glycoside hydrolase family 65 protein n=1 Tax=Humidisolicoccus flavus TaxID=3111414 RepID=UPI00324601FA